MSETVTVRWEGAVIGVQQIEASDFTTLRTVSTSSWVGREFQGIGLGTEMRGAVLAFAFENLGAEFAISTALDYNQGSIRVSEKLGYANNGFRRENVRGKPVETALFRLTRERWDRDRPVSVRVEGLEPCLELLGLTQGYARPVALA